MKLSGVLSLQMSTVIFFFEALLTNLWYQTASSFVVVICSFTSKSPRATWVDKKSETQRPDDELSINEIFENLDLELNSSYA